jgi:hypothetical protein
VQVTESGSGIYQDSSVQGWIKILQQPKSQIRIQNAAIELAWDEFAKAMDAHCDMTRLQADRKGSKRRYSGIELVTRTARLDYASITAAVKTIIELPDFKAGCAVIFGFAIRVNGANTGHAVALYRDNVGNYLFMEPNYGIFTLNQRGVTATVLYIFKDVYHENPAR